MIAQCMVINCLYGVQTKELILKRPITMAPCKDKELLDACKTGKLSEAKHFVSEGANLNYAAPKSQYTPLMSAIEHNHTAIINWLMDKPTVDVDRQNRWKNTALHYAAKYSKDGVMVARLGNMMKKDIVNLLNQDGKTAAICAVEWDGGNIRAVQGLLSITSVDFNIPDKDGRSLLDIAR